VNTEEISNLIKFNEEFLEAWTGNQPEKLISYYTKDAYYQDPAIPMGLKGHDKIFPYFKKLLALNPDWIWKIVETYPTPKGCVVKWKATIPVGSKVIVEYGMDIVEYKDGKISRNEVYFDRTNLVETTKLYLKKIGKDKKNK
jgi:hypothetical protein